MQHRQRHTHRLTRRRARGAVAALAAMAALALGISGLPGGAGTAHATVAIVPGDATADAYSVETVHAATWNICGEAGGDYAGSLEPDGTGAYCPDRTHPERKAQAITAAVKAHHLNALMVQEVCGEVAGTTPYTQSTTAGYTPVSTLDMIKNALNDAKTGDRTGSWEFAWAPALRPGDTPNSAGGSYCRMNGRNSDVGATPLDGTLGVAVLVKGHIASSNWQTLPFPTQPPGAQHQHEPVLCAAVVGWATEVCAVHMVNESYTSQASPTDYDREVGAVAAMVANYPRVVLGGDFNTTNIANASGVSPLDPLHKTLAECDQQPYYPGDQTNEPTHHDYNVKFGPNGTIADGSYDATRIDYLFSTAGFTSCQPLTALADQADYQTIVQPSCLLTATPIVCTPTGISDHAPLVGTTKGGPDLQWRLADGSGATAADGSGNGSTGTLTGSAGWSGDHGGALALDGSSYVATPTPVVDTTRSFTVSAWVNVAPGAPTGVIASQDGGYGTPDTLPDTASGFALWYKASDNTWRFGMPNSATSGSIDDQAAAGVPAQTGVWTQVTGVFDALAGSLTIYVNGQNPGTAKHSSVWPANGSFTVGRDMSSGAPNAYFRGSVQNVTAYTYPMNAAEVLSAATKPSLPTGATTGPAATGPATPGCFPDANFGSAYGTVHSLTPALTVQVTDPDPTKPVHADFSIWDEAGGQPITMGGAGSASASVTGSGAVQVTTPTLVAGDSYGWYARADDGSGVSQTSAVCHFTAGAN